MNLTFNNFTSSSYFFCNYWN